MTIGKSEKIVLEKDVTVEYPRRIGSMPMWGKDDRRALLNRMHDLFGNNFYNNDYTYKNYLEDYRSENPCLRRLSYCCFGQYRDGNHLFKNDPDEYNRLFYYMSISDLSGAYKDESPLIRALYYFYTDSINNIPEDEIPYIKNIRDYFNNGFIFSDYFHDDLKGFKNKFIDIERKVIEYNDGDDYNYGYDPIVLHDRIRTLNIILKLMLIKKNNIPWQKTAGFYENTTLMNEVYLLMFKKLSGIDSKVRIHRMSLLYGSAYNYCPEDDERYKKPEADCNEGLHYISLNF